MVCEIVCEFARPILLDGVAEDEAEREARRLSFGNEHHLEQIGGRNVRVFDAPTAEARIRRVRSRSRRIG